MSGEKFTNGEVKVIKHLLSDMFDLRVGFSGSSEGVLEGVLIARVVSGEGDANLFGVANEMYETLKEINKHVINGKISTLTDSSGIKLSEKLFKIENLLAKARGE